MRLLPLACEWAQEQERLILNSGFPLTSIQVEDAAIIGVSHPGKVRILRIDRIPMPEHPALRSAAEETGLITPATGGLTVMHGIFIRDDCWGDRQLVFHELVHTRQYERLGGFRPFLQQYLQECISDGYPNGSLEQEAINMTARHCPA